MKIAIIGSGISGLVVASRLHGKHQIELFEAGDYVGGHTNTIDVEHLGRRLSIDTGFIVFNDWTYPNFLALLRECKVDYQPTTMGFSLRSDPDNLEYCGSSPAALFAQKRNLIRPRFYRMLLDIVRFNRRARRDCNSGSIDASETLQQYLSRGGYGGEFLRHYLVPMAAAIWSMTPGCVLQFPAQTFIRFFSNHGLLNINDRPQWYVISGGSRRYVEKLTAPFADRIRLRCAVTAVRRNADGVEIRTATGKQLQYDRVVLACHSDQALAMLSDASVAERTVLGAIRYQPNQAVLHTDASLLPKRRVAWAAWNYHLGDDAQAPATLTYNMNILQGINASETFCVTLNNDSSIDPARILRRINYSHPLFDLAAIDAQQRWRSISGINNTFYCGAYWGYGFHEDGVNSALRVVEQLQEEAERAQCTLRRAS